MAAPLLLVLPLLLAAVHVTCSFTNTHHHPHFFFASPISRARSNNDEYDVVMTSSTTTTLFSNVFFRTRSNNNNSARQNYVFPHERRRKGGTPSSSLSSLSLSALNNENVIESSASFNHDKSDVDGIDINSENKGVLDRDEHVRILDWNLRNLTGRGILDRIQQQEGRRREKDNAVIGADGNGTAKNVRNSDFFSRKSDHDTTDSPQNEQQVQEKEDWSEVHTSLRYALLSHSSENGLDGPINNYGNFAALSAFGLSWMELVNLPACRMANPGLDQEEWSEVLQILRERSTGRSGGSTRRGDNKNNDDVLEGYKGFRCTADRVTFYIRDAVVWNCYNDKGEYYGQAILFDREKVTVMDPRAETI